MFIHLEKKSEKTKVFVAKSIGNIHRISIRMKNLSIYFQFCIIGFIIEICVILFRE